MSYDYTASWRPRLDADEVFAWFAQALGLRSTGPGTGVTRKGDLWVAVRDLDDDDTAFLEEEFGLAAVQSLTFSPQADWIYETLVPAVMLAVVRFAGEKDLDLVVDADGNYPVLLRLDGTMTIYERWSAWTELELVDRLPQPVVRVAAP